jgi:2,4-dienoyl-CoA reductase-like NADH-dependent reductase (Old Yellow Enzyme family)
VTPSSGDCVQSLAGALRLARSYDGTGVEQAIASGRANLIALGRPFIASPDWPARLSGTRSLRGRPFDNTRITIRPIPKTT